MMMMMFAAGLGSLQRSPDPLDGFVARETRQKGRGRKGKGKGGEESGGG